MRIKVRDLLTELRQTQRWLRSALKEAGRIINLNQLNDYLTGARETADSDRVLEMCMVILMKEKTARSERSAG